MMEGGVLVDTSVWIEFFNGLESQPVIFLKQQIIEDQPLFLCPIILQEILQGIRSDKDFEKVKDNILSFPILEWDPIDAAIVAAQLYRNLRKKGLTIRKSNDCLIGAFAQRFNLSVLHSDRDFCIMAEQKIISVVQLP